MKMPPAFLAFGLCILLLSATAVVLLVLHMARQEAAFRLKRHIAFLHALLESLDTPLYLKDGEGRYEMANRSFAFLMGVEPAEIRGRSSQELGIDDGSAAGCAEEVSEGCAGGASDQEVLATGMPQAGEYQIWAAGKRRAVFMTKIPLRDERGRPLLLGTIRDLTPERELAEGLRDLNRKLESQVAQRTAELQRANARLERLAATDQLTGLANRRQLDQALDEEMASWKRYGTPLSAIMLDIDHFKEVNDERGHPEGDRVLVWLAGLLRNRVRSTDLAGRWGGEEFYIICRHSILDAAVQLAQALREAVEEGSTAALGFPLTASFGAAQIQEDEGLRAWVSRVDANLYMAKERGRNRVVA